MKEFRSIKRVVAGQNAMDGAGVKLVREIGYYDTKDFDPFLMLDAFDSTNPEDYIKGFPWHPHRGIETITYLISGNIEHGDSMGNRGSILDGDCQWMTAGSGIIHQEMPKPSERMLGTQLWLNLPAKDKMTNPKYRSITRNDIPVIEDKGCRVHVIAGEYNGRKGAIRGDYVDALYFDVEAEADAEWVLKTTPEDTLFIYILMGSAVLGDEKEKPVSEKHVVLFTEGEKFRMVAGKQGIRLFLMSGKPLREPIAWGGPIVMNTREELNKAFEELDNKTFIK